MKPDLYDSQTPKKASFLALFNNNHNRTESLLINLEQLAENCLKESGCCLLTSSSIHQLSKALDFSITEYHSDEEVYVYEPLLSEKDANHKVYSKLLEEHNQIEDSWALLHSMLHMTAHYPTTQSAQELAHRVEDFLKLKRKHMQYEIKHIFPAAKKLIGKEKAQKIAARIMWRRQITGWHSALRLSIS